MAWSWTVKRTRVAQLVAEGELTIAQISEQSGVPQSTIMLWRSQPEFKARVKEIVEAYREEVFNRGIAKLENRVSRLNSDWERLQEVQRQRAQQLGAMGPGTDTGLVVRQEKVIGHGINAQIIEEYNVDTGLLKEIRAHEEQAARELGQWEDRSKVETSGTVTVLGYTVIPPSVEQQDSVDGTPKDTAPAEGDEELG